MIRKILYSCLLYSLFATSALFAEEWDDVYEHVSNMKNPSFSDFLYLQNYLLKGKRDYLKWLDYEWYDPLRADGLRYDHRARNIRLFNEQGRVDQELYQLVYQTSSEDRKRCVISYASCNATYREKIQRIGRYLKRSGFSGHFLYRMGGWPDIKGGSLKFMHVPYSFKLCMIKEAARLGYQQIVWVDSAVIPFQHFNRVFEYLERDGYFFIDHLTTVGRHDSPKVIEAFSLSEEERFSIPQIQASLIGVNMENPRVREFLDECFIQMEKLEGFLSPRPEQVAMGIIAHKMGLFPQIPYTDVFCDDGSITFENSYYTHLLYALSR